MLRWAHVLTALAGLAGAAGMIEAATAAHKVADPLLQTSANFLLIMATASIAVTAYAVAAQPYRAWFLAAASFFLAGSVVFCGDLTLRVFLTQKLFAFAAPIGGSLMIIGWITTALASLVSCFRAGCEKL